jgi:hypothetical protein
MSKNRFEEIVNKIEWRISTKKDRKTKTSCFVKWVLKRYLKYAFEALINGYPIKIRRAVNIYLEVEPIRELTKEEKKYYLTSNKYYGYIFCIKMRGWYFDPEYIFYPEQSILDRLQEVLDSDLVYEFIKS